MSQQLPLRFTREAPGRQVRPTEGASQPVVWVRRLRVLERLAPGESHIVREVHLRRGLNIVWAPIHADGTHQELFSDGVSGHTAGKSTLCRLIRYAFGEPTYAAEATRRRIREALPDGWVVAELVIGEEDWTVARPFGVGPHPFCLRGARAEAAANGEGERLDIHTMATAIDAATVAGLPAREFPTRSGTIEWEHLLPWLTRDQECRFAEFHEWRNPRSESQSPALTADERQFVMRAVLGLLTDDERREQQRNASLVSEQARAKDRAPLLRHQAEVDHARVRAILGQDLPEPDEGLFGARAQREIERRSEKLKLREQELVAADRRAVLQDRLEVAVAAESDARRDLAEATARLEVEENAGRQLEAEARGEGQTALFAALPPGRGYCNVPMDVARENCPLAVSRPHDLSGERAKRTAAEQVEAHRGVVQALIRRTEECMAALSLAGAITREARRELFSAGTSHEEDLLSVMQERAALDLAERLVRHADDAHRASQALVRRLVELGAEIERSYSRQEELRRMSVEALARVSARFDYVVRALLGDSVAGRVETSGRALRLVIDEHGERESAAFETVRLLAFDLAALTASLEGHGWHPRFLLHDGPREADLADDVYERLFLYAHSLEDCSRAEPGFQYIITTTTPPPALLRGEPWLRLELCGTPAERRLLKRDL